MKKIEIIGHVLFFIFFFLYSFFEGMEIFKLYEKNRVLEIIKDYEKQKDLLLPIPSYDNTRIRFSDGTVQTTKDTLITSGKLIINKDTTNKLGLAFGEPMSEKVFEFSSDGYIVTTPGDASEFQKAKKYKDSILSQKLHFKDQVYEIGQFEKDTIQTNPILKFGDLELSTGFYLLNNDTWQYYVNGEPAFKMIIKKDTLQIITL